MKKKTTQLQELQGNYESPQAEVIKVNLETTVCSNTENYGNKNPWE